MDLSQGLTYLKGVGPARADLLAKELNLCTQLDLLYYFPYKYIDRSKIHAINELSAGMPYVQICGKIVSMQVTGEGRSKRLTARLADSTGIVELVWFKGINYAKERYRLNERYLVFGKPSQYGHTLSLAHPDIDLASDRNIRLLTNGLQAFYSTTERMKNSYLNSRCLQKIMQSLFEQLTSPIEETLPRYLVERLHLKSLDESLRQLHFPSNAHSLRDAQYRLKFEELFYLQLHILRTVSQRHQKGKGFVFERIGDCFNRFYHERLPFELTGAQKRVLKEIRANVGSGWQMNRLIQGDVGSGKTLVALMSMLMAVDNGFQACLMAPTEILANQHYESLRELLGPLPIEIGLLTGSTRKKERDQLHAGLQSGSLHLLVGTHALIEESVQFRNLGLVVIDEQHRFGVAQRAKLWKKNLQPPHVLVMTATPIPRTLAMTLYGDLDVSIIDELPPGRKPIRTIHRYDHQSQDLYRFMRQELSLGRQIYMVYPLIEESERSDYKNLQEGYAQIKEAFPDVGVGMVHGRMKADEKDIQMQDFQAGRTRILVATTVIEVGVNVPNASVMVIQNAERFGLSQLHQLRGRVGRGAEQSYCILLSSPKLSDDGRKRLDIMTSTNDGFEISEADLKLRGPGDIEGVQQSGLPFDLKMANLAHDGPIVEYARRIAQQVLQDDPHLEQAANRLTASELKRRYGGKPNWGEIS